MLRLVPWLIVGILLEDVWQTGCPAYLLAVGIVLTLGMWRWPVGQSVGIGVCLLLLGMTLTASHRASLRFPDDGQAHDLQAVVISESAEKPKTVAVDLYVPSNGRRLKAYLHKDQRSMVLKPGDGLLLQARIEPTEHLRLGSFDYGRFLAVNGFTGRCYVRAADWRPGSIDWERLPRWERLRINALRWRHGLLTRYQVLTDGTENHAYSLLVAMTLGERSAVSSDMRHVFSVTGASHVLALSGLHMGILFSLISMLTVFGRRTLVARLTMVVLFWGFALLTGLSVSVVRSALMLSVAAVFAVRGGHPPTVNVLCFAAVLLLLLNPYSLFDVGFQLSFLSVFAILLVMPLLDSLWPEQFLFRHRLLRMLWSVVAVSVAAQIGTAPMVAFHFGQLPVFFVLSNLIVIPCAYLILWLGLCYLLVPMQQVGQALLWVAAGMYHMLSVIAAWPHASIGHLHPSALQTTMIYVVIVSLYLAIAKLRNVKLML